MNWIEIGKQISIFLGIGVALYGIDSWRREHTGKRRIELAEDALALFYEAMDAIKYMRHPASFSSETDDIEKDKGETENQYQARKNASVVFKRYNDHQEIFNKLHAMRYRFMAQIGKNKAEPFNDIRKIINEIISSARRLSRLWDRSHFQTEEQWNKHQEQINKHEAVFWEEWGEEDPINLRLEKVIDEIEKTCNSVIAGEGTLHALLNIKVGKGSYRDRSDPHRPPLPGE